MVITLFITIFWVTGLWAQSRSTIINPICFEFVYKNKFIKGCPNKNVKKDDCFNRDYIPPKNSKEKRQVYSTERFFDWSDDYSKGIITQKGIGTYYENLINELNTDRNLAKQMDAFEANPNVRGNLTACPEIGAGTDFTKCRAYNAYCAENLVSGAFDSEMSKLILQSELCLNANYLKNDINRENCKNLDSFSNAKDLEAIGKKLAASNSKKKYHTKQYFNYAKEDFDPIRNNLSAARDKIRKIEEDIVVKQTELMKIKDQAGACKAFLNNESNPQNRDILNEILPCGVEDLVPLESIPPDFLESMQLLENFHRKETVQRVLDKTQENALYNNFISRLSMEEHFNGLEITDTENRKELLGKALGSSGTDGKIDKFYNDVKARAINDYTNQVRPTDVSKFWDENRVQANVGEFNKVVDEINQFCDDSRKQHNAVWGHILSGTGNSTYIGYAAKKSVEEINTPRANELVSKLYGTNYGKLMFANNFSLHVGTFDPENCVDGEWWGLNSVALKKIPTDKASRDKLLTEATNQLKVSAKDHAKNLSADRKAITASTSSDEQAEILKKYLKGNPAAFKHLLEVDPNSEDFLLSCYLIKKILDDDHAKVITNYVVAGGAGAAGGLLMLSGLGAPIGASLLGVATSAATALSVITIANGATNYYDSKVEEKLYKQGGISANKEGGLALKQANLSRIDQETVIQETTLEVGGMVLGTGVRKIATILPKISPSPAVVSVTDNVLHDGRYVDDLIPYQIKKLNLRTKITGEIEGPNSGVVNAESSMVNVDDVIPKALKNRKEDLEFDYRKVTSEDASAYDQGYDVIVLKDKSGKKIGSLSYEIENGEMSIGWARVDDDFRGQGLQNLLFEEALKKNSEVRVIKTSLDGVNAEVLNKELARIIKSQPDFKPSSVELDPARVESMFKSRDKVNGAYIQLDLQHLRELNECCRNYISTLPKDQLDNLVKEAIKKTPAWKSRSHFGFDQMGATDINFRFNKDLTFSPVIRFKSLRSGPGLD